MSIHDAALARAAAGQHGNLTTVQARDLGMSYQEISWRLRQGVLHAVHPGVYRHAAVAASPSARLHAAVLACGAGAAASHRSAAHLHQLRGVPRWRPEVTVLGTRFPLLEGVTVHRTDTLGPEDVASVDRLAVTTIPRTLLDLGAVVPLEVVELAAQDAMIRELITAIDLVCLLERVGKRGRRGTAALRAVVGSSLPRKGIESMLELELQRLVERCAVPRPVLQYEITVAAGQRFRLDSAWPEFRITIEGDGRRWHSTRRDFERDLARIRAITAAGWDHYRYGWNDVRLHPAKVQAEITAVVGAAAAAHRHLCRLTHTRCR